MIVVTMTHHHIANIVRVEAQLTNTFYYEVGEVAIHRIEQDQPLISFQQPSGDPFSTHVVKIIENLKRCDTLSFWIVQTLRRRAIEVEAKQQA